jgi:dihydroflavonol-4-reductase
MPKKTTIMVTGASGYIAKHIVLKLLNAGYRVRGSVRSAHRAEDVRAALRNHLPANFDLDAVLTFVELDLNSDKGWSEALGGIDVLMHTASPFPTEQPDDEDDLIRPAVDGTLRALNAAVASGINRVVLTSSTAAVAYRDRLPENAAFNESHWTDINHPTCLSYAKSKTLAEKAAWDLIKTQAPSCHLTTINPALVLGPPLDMRYGTSLHILVRLLAATDPALPKLGLACIDVRDVAEMHVRAIDRQETFGKRIIGVSQSLWIRDIAMAIKAAHPERRIITRIAPDWLMKIAALFDRQIRSIVPNLSQKPNLDNNRAKALLDMDFIEVDQSILDTANFLIDNKLA